MKSINYNRVTKWYIETDSVSDQTFYKGFSYSNNPTLVVLDVEYDSSTDSQLTIDSNEN
jgi:hypothetical protein